MIVAHLVIGMTLGFVAAVWACGEGYSLLAMIGFYMLAGNLGVAASAAAALVRGPRTALRSQAPTTARPAWPAPSA
jgi:hypothetical protein